LGNNIYYGKLVLENEVTLKDIVHRLLISFKRFSQNIFLYKRSIGEHIIEKKLVIKDNTVGIYPASPALVNSEYSEYVYIKLKKGVVIEKDASIFFYVKAPISIALTTSANNVFDTFTFNEKHALYGTLIRGVLTRYMVSDVHLNKPKTFFGEALVKIHVINSFKKAVEVSRIVFPVTGTPVFYKNGDVESWYGEVILKIIDDETAEVMVSENKPREDLAESPVKAGSLKKSFTMEWGI